jgi:hypothetical protein
MRVLFTAAPGPFSGGERFQVGQVYDLPASSADRWKLRGIAVDAPEEKPAPAPAPALAAQPQLKPHRIK